MVVLTGNEIMTIFQDHCHIEVVYVKIEMFTVLTSLIR